MTDHLIEWTTVWADRPWLAVSRATHPEQTSTPIRVQQGNDIRYLSEYDALEQAHALTVAVAISRRPTRCTRRDEDHAAGRVTCGYCLIHDGDVEAEVHHFCAHCKRLTEGSWAVNRSAAVGGEADVFVCGQCSTVTHADCEE